MEEKDLDRLFENIRSLGCKECLVVLVEPLINTPKYFRIKLVIHEFDKAHHQYASFHYAIIPFDCSFVVLYSPDDFVVVAGPKKFVIDALGVNIKAAREMFDDYVNLSDMEPEHTYFIELANSYREFDG